nr:ATP-dependent DNA helicase [Corynebacterium lactis]
MGDGDHIEGLLAAAVKSLGGATRPNQVKMARAVASAFERERHLAVQAGTGTGKSLAYLVPSIVQAMESGESVIVSTATIALQRQLVERDLPRLVKALEPLLERTPTFAILKGRSNYLCQNKVNNVAEDPSEGSGPGADGGAPEALISPAQLSRTAAEVLRLREWSSQTDTGDRDSLDKGVSNEAWRQVSVTARECVGAMSCPFGESCFAEAARREAADVDIVVTNHALLAIDALSEAMILPEHSCVVVDEAHELDARITSVATDELSPAGITMMARRAKKFGAAEEIDDLTDATEMLSETVASLADDYTGALEDIPGELGMALASVRDALWKLQTVLATAGSGGSGSGSSSSGGIGESSEATERQTVRAAVENMHDTVVRILDFSDDDVVWLGERSAIYVAPLSVADLLRAKLFGESTVVLTSATLALGGKFDAMAAAWGLPSGTWDGMDVGTPFDPQRSGILYVARDLPKPGRDGASPDQFKVMEQLIRAAGGRTLGLFSSRRGAEAAAEEMRGRLPFDVLCQGEDSIGALVDKFAASENTCLFGTLTLWQGVDVPGPSLSCVIIDRIPFPRPDDPLLSARADAAKAAGRNGFMEVSATHAALLMAQGAGRLLRSVDDRGVVAVLDSRLATARYGTWIAASMPDFWRTTDLKTATGALERLVAKRLGR